MKIWIPNWDFKEQKQNNNKKDVSCASLVPSLWFISLDLFLNLIWPCPNPVKSKRFLLLLSLSPFARLFPFFCFFLNFICLCVCLSNKKHFLDFYIILNKKHTLEIFIFKNFFFFSFTFFSGFSSEYKIFLPKNYLEKKLLFFFWILSIRYVCYTAVHL